MSHGETDTFEAYLKGEHVHVPRRVHSDPLTSPIIFIKESFSEHDLHNNKSIQFVRRVAKGAFLGVLLTSPSWAFKSRFSAFANKMIEQQTKRKLFPGLQDAWVQIQPYAMAGAGFGFFSHLLLDWAEFDTYYTHLFLSSLGGLLLARAMPQYVNSPKMGFIAGLGYSATTQHFEQLSKLKPLGMAIPDKDRTEEEQYRASLEKYLVDLTYNHQGNLKLQHFEKL